MSEAEAHGVAIICERHDGHTVAWEDSDISIHVPAGWFVEWWPDRRVTFAGRLNGSYVMCAFHPAGEPPRRAWMDWADAAAWCEKQAKQRGRKGQAA